MPGRTKLLTLITLLQLLSSATPWCRSDEAARVEPDAQRKTISLGIAPARSYPFDLGEPIDVILTYHEEGRQGATVDVPPDAELIVRDEQGQSTLRVGRDSAPNQLVACKEIGQFSQVIDLAAHFRMDRPGQYIASWKIGDVTSNWIELTVRPSLEHHHRVEAEDRSLQQGIPASGVERQLNALMGRFRLLQAEEWDLARKHWSQLSKEEQGRFLARVQHQPGPARAERISREEAEQYVDKARSRASAEQWEQIIADPRLLTPDEQRSLINRRDEVIQEIVRLGEPAVPLLIQRAAFLAREVRGHPQLRTGWGEQRYAEMALGRMEAVAVPYLLEALESEEALARESAARALGPIQDERSVEPLIKLLSDTGSPVRYAAAQALTEIGDARATKSLVKALADEYHMVRWWAVRGLEKFGDSSCIAPLEELARTNPGRGKGDIRPHVSRAIEAIRSREQPVKESEVE